MRPPSPQYSRTIWFGSLMSFALSTCVLAAKPQPQALDRKGSPTSGTPSSPGSWAVTMRRPMPSTSLKCGRADTFDQKRIELELGWGGMLSA